MATNGGSNNGPSTTGDPALDALVAQLKAGGGGSNTGATNLNWGTTPVYWGQTPPANANSANVREGRGGTASDHTVSADAAVGSFYTWTPDELAAWGNRLYKSGLIDDPGDYSKLYTAWQDSVKMAANYFAAGKKMTPWDVIDLQEGLAAKRSATPKTSTNVSRSLNIPSADEADSITKTMFQNLLGRDPNDGELSRYRSLLIGKAKENPSVTTTLQTTDGKGNTTQDSSTSGGFTSAMAQEAVTKSAQTEPGYGAYLAATTYFNYLQNSLKAPA